jgi:hypothetical protein
VVIAVAVVGRSGRSTGPRATAADTVAGRERAARGRHGAPPVRSTRREPVVTSASPTQVSGRLRVVLDARVRTALARCADRGGSAAATRVFVSFIASVGERVDLEEIALRGTSGPVAALEARVREALGEASLEVPEGAVAGRFPVTISATVAVPGGDAVGNGR